MTDKYNELYVDDLVQINLKTKQFVPQHLNNNVYSIVRIIDAETIEICVNGELVKLNTNLIEKIIEQVSIITEYNSNGTSLTEYIVQFPSKRYKDQYLKEERIYTYSKYIEYLSCKDSSRLIKKGLYGSAQLSFVELKQFKQHRNIFTLT